MSVLLYSWENLSVFLHSWPSTVIHPSEIMQLSKDAGGIVSIEDKLAKEQEYGFDTDMSVLASKSNVMW